MQAILTCKCKGNVNAQVNQMNNANAKLNQLPNGQYASKNHHENYYESSNQHANSTTMKAQTMMQAQISNQHDDNAIMGDDECLRQGLYLQDQERAW